MKVRPCRAPVRRHADPTGLVFKQPQEGLRLLDAQPRAGGVDLLWFEWAPERKSRSSLGGARLVTGFVKPDGTLDKGSKIAVTDGDLEYGFVRDRKGARLATSDAGSVLSSPSIASPSASFGARSRSGRAFRPTRCSARSIRRASRRPSRRSTSSTRSSASRSSSRGAPSGSRRATSASSLKWAGDRAVFLQGAMRSSPRRARLGEARAEPNPFVARRSHRRWGAFASDGEGVAVVGDDVVHVAASGEVELLPIGADAARAGPCARPRSRSSGGAPRGSVARGGWRAPTGSGVFPSPSAAKLPAEVGAFDASAVVGGATRGLLVQVSGEGELGASSRSTLVPERRRAPFSRCSPTIAGPGRLRGDGALPPWERSSQA